MQWLEQVCEQLAATSGQEPGSLRLTPDQMRELLDLEGAVEQEKILHPALLSCYAPFGHCKTGLVGSSC